MRKDFAPSGRPKSATDVNRIEAKPCVIHGDNRNLSLFRQFVQSLIEFSRLPDNMAERLTISRVKQTPHDAKLPGCDVPNVVDRQLREDDFRIRVPKPIYTCFDPGNDLLNGYSVQNIVADIGDESRSGTP